MLIHLLDGSTRAKSGTPNMATMYGIVYPDQVVFKDRTQVIHQVSTMVVYNIEEDLEKVSSISIAARQALGKDPQDIIQAVSESIAGSAPRQPNVTIPTQFGGGRTPTAEELAELQYQAFSYVRHGKVQELEDCLDSGVIPDVRDGDGNTLLMIACQNGSKKLAKMLLRRGANTNLQNVSWKEEKKKVNE